MPSDLQAIHDQFMAALNAQDAAASQQMLDVWSKAWLHIQAAIQQLDARIEKAKQLGQFSPSWAYQQGRLDDVEQTVKNQIENLVATATQLTLNNQEHAITQGQAFAEQSAIAQLGGIAQMATVGVRWGRLNPEAVKDLTGYLADGSPLTALLDQLPQQAATAVRQALVNGIALGQSPRVTAAAIRREAAVPLIRAERIARTETMRAYRTASLRSMQANTSIIDGWIWLCSLSKRTCAICLAMNGTWHPVDEMMASHVSCRCVMAPKTKSWQEILDDPDADIPDTSVDVSENAGWDFYQAQNVATQNYMVGPGKRKLLAALNEDGIENPLPLLVGYRVDPQWGPERFEKPLKELLPLLEQ